MTNNNMLFVLLKSHCDTDEYEVLVWKARRVR